MTARIGIVGARGHAGGELLRLLDGHAEAEVAFAASRAHAGEPVQALAPSFSGRVTVSAPDPAAAAAAGLDACVLALPNGLAAPFVAAFDAASPDTALIDLSADFRFDDGWAYGLPEINRKALRGARRIANPGCYATAAQLALHPLKELLDGPAAAFGLSAYSGAGTTPGPRNDPERLADNVMPYALAGHVHEAEIRRHLGARVNFTPHVAQFFRGLIATVQAPLSKPLTEAELRARYDEAYAAEPMVRLAEGVPEVRDGQGIDGAVLGGFAAVPDERRAVVVCALDNLLKGAASQAVQNLNLALGCDELTGLSA